MSSFHIFKCASFRQITIPKNQTDRIVKVIILAVPFLKVSVFSIIEYKYKCNFLMQCTSLIKSRKENPQKLTQLSSKFHPRHLVGKRTAQKDTTIDTTSDSQVNSNFPYRWSPASLTFNNYFYLFLYLYIT